MKLASTFAVASLLISTVVATPLPITRTDGYYHTSGTGKSVSRLAGGQAYARELQDFDGLRARDPLLGSIAIALAPSAISGARKLYNKVKNRKREFEYVLDRDFDFEDIYSR